MSNISYQPKPLPPIIRLSTEPKAESVTLLLYGAAGTGKTEFAGTAPNPGIINSGLGLVTLQSPGFKSRHKSADPLVITIQEEPIPDRAEGFDLVCDAMDAMLNHPDVKTIILDDATALRRFAMNKGLEINQSEGKSMSLGKSKVKGMVMKSIQDYGSEMDLIDQFIVTYTGMCKAAKKHFILTAHERIQYTKAINAQGNTIIGAPPIVDKIRPGFTGQTFPDSVTGHFDLVWYMEVIGSGTRQIYQANTVPANKFIAKTRWGGLFPSTITNPDFSIIVDQIRRSG